MKCTRSHLIIVYLLTGAFLVGLGLFLFRLFTQGEQWATNPVNDHLSTVGSLAGTITDRNGVVLAETVDGERHYNDNETVRRATLHTVGDNTRFISTSVQNLFRSQLAGYNPLTGISLLAASGKGNDIHLTLDSSLCAAALEGLNGKKGAVAIYNYKTGEILCMVSSPTYDPANRPDIEADESGQYEGVYLNNVLSSSYTPGSTFKIITCAAAVDNIPDIYQRTFTCNGSVVINGQTITCMANHGNINFEDGMSKSCNVVFAELAVELGKDKMTEAANKMGFNKSFEIEGIPTAKSVYDVTQANDGDLGWSGVGQYTNLENPAHMMMLMGAIANGGRTTVPYFIDRITSPISLPSHVGHGKTGEELLSSGAASSLQQLMRYTVQNNYGDDLFPGLTVCAKTGTGEVGEGKEPNGWMVGFSTDADCPLAFAIVVEEGGFGISSAGRIASKLLPMAAEQIRK